MVFPKVQHQTCLHLSVPGVLVYNPRGIYPLIELRIEGVRDLTCILRFLENICRILGNIPVVILLKVRNYPKTRTKK